MKDKRPWKRGGPRWSRPLSRRWGGAGAALGEGHAERADTRAWKTDGARSAMDPENLLGKKVKAKEYHALHFFRDWIDV